MIDRYDFLTIKNKLKDILATVNQNVMPDLWCAINSSIKKMEEPMQLAIIGKISSSKSTLVNAILGKEEVMATGQMEITYNVGWLKYGSPDSDIIVHHKDGTPPSYHSPNDFLSWSANNENSTEIQNVSYIELFDDAEILRQINIIDTPGLDAVRGQDSQNTLDFLSKIRPDAVIMLFTNSISENILDVVSRFNSCGVFNPLNAIGVLAKIDNLWLGEIDRNITALQIGNAVVNNLMTTYPILRKSIFKIYPMSALAFLKSTTISEADFRLIAQLADTDDETLSDLLFSIDEFVNDYDHVNLDKAKRIELGNKYGLYVISMIINSVKKKPSITFQAINKMLYEESGAEVFMRVLHNHFGNRSDLIKLESIYQVIKQTLMQEHCVMANSINTSIEDIFSSLVLEHKEYELLYKIYNEDMSKLDMDEEMAAEFKRICGEYGNSAPERLGFDTKEDWDVDDLLNYAQSREEYWRAERNKELDPDIISWKNTLCKSYGNLRYTIEKMNYNYNKANAFLYNK
jgi:hypothetical protein